MATRTLRTARFTAAWLTGRAAVDERAVVLDRGDREVPADLYVPRGAAPPLPGWVVLHGITVPGRRHDQLRRFGRSLAASGAVALVPEVPEWTHLHLAPDRTAPTILAGARALHRTPEVGPAPVGVLGFSFGALQAVAACQAPDVASTVAGVGGFGGYWDLDRTVQFLLTGRHEWKGRVERVRPDPYGRWIVAANYLTGIPEHAEADDVADALRTLAAEAGRHRVPAWSATYDPLRARLREGVAPQRRELFDVFARASDAPDPELEEVEGVAAALTAAARRVDPLMDPRPRLADGGGRIRLVHGRGDRLIPYTETLRAREHLEGRADVDAAVTGLFAHSTQEGWPGPARLVREAIVFFRAMRELLVTV